MTSLLDLRREAAWRSFLRLCLIVAGTLTFALYAFILALDPYGTRTGPGRPPTPIMEVNQRYMYPQLARSGLFDSAVFGTSTLRLLEPSRLGQALGGGHFANLGMNGATPWEQLRMAELFLRYTPSPRTVVMGLDRSWCALDADAETKRLTFRSFPSWLFDEDPWNDLAGSFSLRALELAGRVALNRLRLMPERIRGDGYEYFLPPERHYDLDRARVHLRDPTEHLEALRLPAVIDRTRLRFPAVLWLDGYLDRLRPETKVILILPPIHVAAQAAPGTPEAVVDDACKDRLAEVADRHGAMAVDFRLASSVTRQDSNYWDKLHYRSHVADWLARSLATAAREKRDDPEGGYRVLSSGRF